MNECKHLRNLGPQSQRMLTQAGIYSPLQLRTLGSVQAWLQVKQHLPHVSRNLLWAIEGALQNKPWQHIAKVERLQLLLELEAAQEHIHLCNIQK